MTDIHRPRERQGHVSEHPLPRPPRAVIAPPEDGMGQTFGLKPTPVLWPPPPRIAVAAGIDELEVVSVCDVVTLDREGLHRDTKSGKLVIPAEWDGLALGAERGDSSRNLHPFLFRSTPFGTRRVPGGRPFL